jgi:arginase
MRLQPVIVPYRYDEREAGLGLGPGALLEAGLGKRLVEAGHDVATPVAAILADEELEDGSVALNVGKLGSKTALLVAEARRRQTAALVVTGDCTAAVGVVSGLQQADGVAAPIGVVWIDAHGDFNTPDISMSGILAGMPVAILAGLAEPDWRNAAGLAVPIPTDRIVLAGVRDLDEKEATLLRSTNVQVVSTGDIRAGRPFQAALDRLAAACDVLYLHVDLDVLDPRLVPSSSTPAAGGLEIDETADAMARVLRTGKVAAVGVANLNPGAGARGERSLKSTLALLERGLVDWDSLPGSGSG